MLQGKYTTLIGVIVFIVVLGIVYYMMRQKSSESYVPGHSFTWKKDRVIADSRQAAEKGSFYSVPGQYQSMLNPRFSNLNYGAQIKYKMPSYQNLAVPEDPLEYRDMVKENYVSKGCVSGEDKVYHDVDIQQSEKDEVSGNYDQVLSELQKYPEATDMVPVGDMTTVNALGESTQSVVYDRFIYANRNSRLRALGDPIRGDLPITPCSAEWFRPSVHPNIDLHQGAMNVLGGADNSTTQALAELINRTSGDTIIAGVNMASERNVNTEQALSTVNVMGYA